MMSIAHVAIYIYTCSVGHQLSAWVCSFGHNFSVGCLQNLSQPQKKELFFLYLHGNFDAWATYRLSGRSSQRSWGHPPIIGQSKGIIPIIGRPCIFICSIISRQHGLHQSSFPVQNGYCTTHHSLQYQKLPLTSCTVGRVLIASIY